MVCFPLPLFPSISYSPNFSLFLHIGLLAFSGKGSKLLSHNFLTWFLQSLMLIFWSSSWLIPSYPSGLFLYVTNSEKPLPTPMLRSMLYPVLPKPHLSFDFLLYTYTPCSMLYLFICYWIFVPMPHEDIEDCNLFFFPLMPKSAFGTKLVSKVILE